ncbi:Gfo/Idh/MocA family oxidoreductase [Halogeometricum sp. S1BR25-6]|uniref:Gfo/Idh/MocA family oxidoreductase n=1 Tax=Halogeometricum salsisoli TaxID=2950536 RepID=A0ABU2GLI4_9EURY|nr:Gfo/Idh/MocA family oxidoreductase [Halogeometricum sp. S1BR25-6]MDS0301153.1 Gfo/Idh/MocA family oxidoreductase [Halogeometricum sp. S1BR25-6]
MRKIVAVGPETAVRAHVERYDRFDDASVVGVAGVSETFADDVGLSRYESAARALADTSVDGVDVCGPGAAHGDALRSALGAGVPVRCDPPLALDDHEFDHLVSLASEGDGWLTAHSPHRHSRLYDRLRSAVDAGTIGSIGVARIKRTAPFDGAGWNSSYAGVSAAADPVDVLCSVLAHDVDVLTWTFGSVERVFARARTSNQYDYAHAMLTFRDGGQATVEATWNSKNASEPRVAVEYSGNHGRLDFDESDAATALRNGDGPQRVDPPEDDCRGRLLRTFLDQLEGEERSPSAVDPTAPSRTATAMRRSVVDGRPVTLPGGSR